MKTSDYIVKYIIDKGITDVFGYSETIAVSLWDIIFDYSTEG